MHYINWRMERLKTFVFAGALAAASVGVSAAPMPAITPIKNVVLVHGAFADGSGWKPVYDRLVAKGFKVSVVQEPETSLAADVEMTRRVIDMADGPVVLVGHSWGGQVITEAGEDSKVAALVYIAALMPDKGESVDKLEGSMPAVNNDVKKTADGKYYYLDPAAFQADFAADSPADVAGFLAHSQVLVAVEALDAPVASAAWRTKPSFAILPGADKTINPKLQTWMYARAKAEVAEVPGASHTVFLSHSDIVVSVIEKAAETKQ